MKQDAKERLLVPALITGTSGEFMGRKPRPRLLRQRNTVFILGPEGVGKSTVARLLLGSHRLDLHTREFEGALLARVKEECWTPEIDEAPALLIDGPCWLRHRPGAQQLVIELIRDRALAGRRTAICQVEDDGSVEDLIARTEPGSAVVMGLRFPVGRRTRLRVARQICRDLDLPLEAAEGSERIEPWRYDTLVAYLVDRAWRPT
jgi:ABC-type transport system involved in cytochrome bd biosynthesis fused ATPase/permease subunit